MVANSSIVLGAEVGTGEVVTIQPQHMAVTGQTQQSGKTTTLEALATRSGSTALTFITKRGEGSFASGHRVQPYFRDRADWQFVDQLLEAQLHEKNKFLRQWIIKLCDDTKTLADVQRKIRARLPKAKGLTEGVYIQLDAYLELIVPEIERADLAPTLALKRAAVNVMDVSGFTTPMQMLFVQSAIDWVNEHYRDIIVVVPEAWEFIPEGKGSPVKQSAVVLVRKGAALGNYIWVDSQDMAGVDKTILRGCTTWLIGVQREANEIKRTIANIPASIKRPNAADIALLERGQFFACFGRHCIKTYVQPAWLPLSAAINVARGGGPTPEPPPRPVVQKEDSVTPERAAELERENKNLKDEARRQKREIDELRARLDRLATTVPAPSPSERPPNEAQVAASQTTFSIPTADVDALLAEFKRRAAEDPGILSLLRSVPTIEVAVKRHKVELDDKTPLGKVAALVAGGFFDSITTGYAAYAELTRIGKGTSKPNVYNACDKLASMGFLTKEADGFKSVAGMKVNIVDAD